jgi:hypothetical protein
VDGSLALTLVLLGPPVETPTSAPESPEIPTRSAELPEWTEAPTRAPSPSDPKLPFDGGGALATGSIMVIASVAMAATSITLATMPFLDGEGELGLAAGMLGAGGIGVLTAC